MRLEHLDLNLAAGTRLLILEPSKGAADSLAAELGASTLGVSAEGKVYGDHSTTDVYDVVLELGLLDALAMAPAESPDRIRELQRASEALSAMLRPGALWLSASAVPPQLRLPLLHRLAAGAFATPEEHAVRGVVLSPRTTPPEPPRLRGSLGPVDVTNLLMYGHESPEMFLYKLQREEAQWSASAFSPAAAQELEKAVAQQRIRDDL